MPPPALPSLGAYRVRQSTRQSRDPRTERGADAKPCSRDADARSVERCESLKVPELSLRITVVDPVPGVWLRLQSGRADLVQESSRTPTEVSFDFSVRVGSPRPDGRPTFLGPLTQGPPAARFVYINAGGFAGQAGTPWNRRAKIPLGGISQEQVSAALSDPGVVLEVRYPGRGRDGGPTCATVHLPPGAWMIRNKTAVIDPRDREDL